jgi:O-antigen/teichoic acid export membrane protein
MNRPLPYAATARAAPLGLRARLGETWLLAHRWKGRLFFAFADQGIYSATNFLLTVLYASWLPLDTFGRYVVLWTVSLFIETVQSSLIVDSLPAIVSRHGRRNRQRLDAAALWVVLGYSAATSFLLLAAAIAIIPWRPIYTAPLIALAFANPAQRLYLFFRRLCYIRDRQDVAALGALFYALLSIAGTFVLIRADTLSLAAIIVLWGLAALAAILAALAMGIGRLHTTRAVNVVWLVKQIWQSGGWLSGAAVAAWITNWAIFPVVAMTTGAGTAGIIRALQNLLTPILQFNAALQLAILPRVADKVADIGDHYGQWFALRGTAMITGLTAIYCGVILTTAHALLPLLYKKPEIAAAASLLWPLALALVLEAARQASAISLLANRRTRIVFVSRFASLAVFVVCAALLHAFMGFAGILWATVLASATGAAIVLGQALRPISNRSLKTELS